MEGLLTVLDRVRRENLTFLKASHDPPPGLVLRVALLLQAAVTNPLVGGSLSSSLLLTRQTLAVSAVLGVVETHWMDQSPIRHDLDEQQV